MLCSYGVRVLLRTLSHLATAHEGECTLAEGRFRSETTNAPAADQRRPKSQNPTDTLNYATSSSKDQNCFSALSAEEALEEVEDGTEEARGGDLGLERRDSEDPAQILGFS